MDKTAVAHWSPEIGGQFWWNGIFFALVLFSLGTITPAKIHILWEIDIFERKA